MVLASRHGVIAFGGQRLLFLLAYPINTTTDMLHNAETVEHHTTLTGRKKAALIQEFHNLLSGNSMSIFIPVTVNL